MSKYVLLKKTLTGIPTLVKPEDIFNSVDSGSEWYRSLYLYNEEQAKQIKETRSHAGIRDVKTNKLFFDFDSAKDVSLAQKDALEVIRRLQKDIPAKDIEVYFSSSKGFHVEVDLVNMLNPRQLVMLAKRYAGDLPTFDAVVYDAARIIRMPHTKNPKSGLYKIPLDFFQLNSPIDAIKNLAKTPNTSHDYISDSVTLNDDLIPKEEPQQAKKQQEEITIDLDKRPQHWTKLKWSLLNAVGVEAGQRHNALIRIGATCRGLGYDETMTRALCLSFDEKYQANTNEPPMDVETALEKEVLNSVFSDSWNGGMYSIKNDVWLQDYASKLDIETESDQDETITIDSAFDMFKDYAVNIDKLTIKTGIDALDAKVRMTIGMSVGIVAAPGVGKTSIALQILNSMSKTNEQSIFFSFDMYHALVFQKLVQKHLKVNDTTIFEKFQNGDVEFEQQVKETLKTEYKNVDFCFKTGMTPNEIEKTIRNTEKNTGKKIRLVIVDYSELVLTDLSDMTAGSAQVAQKLREIATKLNVCVLVLLQPNKMAGSPADELTSYRNLKGSSSSEQALSLILGMSRPGYDPRYPNDDQFITIKCLKSRMGPLFILDLGWSGMTGDIYELTDEQEQHLSRVRERIKNEESKDNTKDDWS